MRRAREIVRPGRERKFLIKGREIRGREKLKLVSFFWESEGEEFFLYRAGLKKLRGRKNIGQGLVKIKVWFFEVMFIEKVGGKWIERRLRSESAF